MRRALMIVCFCTWVGLSFAIEDLLSERNPLVIVEIQGNSSYECILSGPCVACTYAEKQNEEIYHCSLTGYYIPYKCVKHDSSEEDGDKFKEKMEESSRKLLGDDSTVHHIHKSCVPREIEDRLTVFGFEVIMLGLLSISSPVVYYRKKRCYAPSGMSRLPTTIPRF